MATSEYQLIAQQALSLPAEDQLRLIQQLAEKLSRSQKQQQGESVAILTKDVSITNSALLPVVWD